MGINYHLHFEEKDGALAAPLPLEDWEPLVNAPYCLPWIKNGKRGLLYCSVTARAAAEEELRTAIKEAPLLAQVVGRLAHWIDFDDFRLFRIPRPAAAFAGIRGDAVLTQISEGLLLLQSDEPDTPDPRKGTLIRAEF